MMNIAIIIPTLMSGGAEKQSLYLAKELSKKYNVYLIVLKKHMIEQKLLNIIENTNVNKVFLSGNLIKNMINIYSVFKSKNIQFIFSYLASANFINSVVGFTARVPSRIGGIRNAVLSKKKLKYERFFHNYLLTGTISNSNSAMELLSKQGFKEEKFHVIHNAFNLQTDKIIRDENKIVKILSVSRFVEQKDYMTALETISILKQNIYDTIQFKYIIVGYGKLEEEIRKRIESLNISCCVEVVVNPDNINEYYQDSDIFFMTSLFEGMSNSVMEALSYSLPVVATPVGDTKYLVKHGENGFLCEPKNSENMASRLKTLVLEYELRNIMSNRSYEILSKDFTLNKFRQEYMEYIEMRNTKDKF
jgi:glycosyltransferase involved in cell wall biosynthesis